MVACFDPDLPACLRCEMNCPRGENCIDGRCQGGEQSQCPPAPDQTLPCDIACCIGTQCLERPSAQAGSTALWLDWTSLDDAQAGPIWYDRSTYKRETKTTDPAPSVTLRAEARLLANSSSDRYIGVPGLTDALGGEEDFLLLFAGAQSCDDFVGDDVQCALNHTAPGAGFRLCIADPGGSPAIRNCDQSDDSTPGCKALVAPPSTCGRFGVLGLRRFTSASEAATSQSLLELRHDGRAVASIDSATANLKSARPLRVGGAPIRPYSGAVALVAVLTGSIDAHETCLIEHFILESLKAAGLRDESDPIPDGCG
jgi:hypothetical protein